MFRVEEEKIFLRSACICLKVGKKMTIDTCHGNENFLDSFFLKSGVRAARRMAFSPRHSVARRPAAAGRRRDRRNPL
jgi:hypothetical protein